MRKMNVAYLRVSTETQTEKYGLDLQRQKILDYCEKKGVVVDRWYIDGGYSGSKLDRPEIQKLLDDAENDLISTVYIYKLDRISRDTIDTLDLIYRILPKYGVKIVSMTEEIRTENPMDKVMLTMNAAMNQYEREVIRMRMSAGMLERVKKGYWMGGGRVPWGYYYDRNDGILHVDEEQAEMVRSAYKLYLDGYSFVRISNILGFKGDKIVADILRRKSNLGLIEYKGKVYKGLHEPIVDEKTFYDTQAMMKRRSNNSHVANNHLLTGLCYCGVCGARMRYQKWGSYHKLVCYSQDKKSGKEYMRKSDNCDNIKPNASEVEKEVLECFKEFSINLDNVEAEENDSAELIQKSIKTTNAKIKRMYEIYFEKGGENLLELISAEEEKVKSLEQELLEETSKLKDDNSELVAEIKSMADVWDSLDRKEKNRILKECIERIVITNGDIEVYFRTIFPFLRQ